MKFLLIILQSLLLQNTDVNMAVQNEMQFASVITPAVPKSVEMFGQKVDLSRWDMKERFEREITNMCYSHNNTLLTLKRSKRILPIITPILKEEGLPEDFIYLCCIESSLDTRARSGVGAAGLWQFMKETGMQKGLIINAEVDERYNVEKSTRAACKYLKEAYEKFGDWFTVAASYNCGQAGVSRRSRNQKQTSAFDLLLPEETSRYIFRLMTMREVLNHPSAYGFHLGESQYYKPIGTKKVEVTKSIADLAEFAAKHDISYYQLVMFNPWLRDTKLTLRPGQKYTILIPNKKDMYY